MKLLRDTCLLSILVAAGCQPHVAPEPKSASDELVAEGSEDRSSEASHEEAEVTEPSPAPPPEPAAESKMKDSGTDQAFESTGQPSTEKVEESSSKKSCQGLPKTRCEITLGCAWSTDKVCVSQ